MKSSKNSKKSKSKSKKSGEDSAVQKIILEQEEERPLGLENPQSLESNEFSKQSIPQGLPKKKNPFNPNDQSPVASSPSKNPDNLFADDEPIKKKKKKGERRKQAANKNLKVNSYKGTQMYPHLNDIYGTTYDGSDKASAYSGCIRCAGSIPRTCCFLCAPCRCGPILEIPQGNVGLVTEFGRFIKKLGPGLHSYNSCSQQIIQVDTRLQVINIPNQALITKDNISVYFDCFVQFRVMVPELAVFRLNDYRNYISYTTMGTMKTVIAEKTLNELLVEEDQVEDLITEIIENKVDDFGLHIDSIETLKIQLSQETSVSMASVPLAQKEAEAKIIDSRGNYESARIFREAADELSKNPASLQLHYFEKLKEMASEDAEVTLMPGTIIDALF